MVPDEQTVLADDVASDAEQANAARSAPWWDLRQPERRPLGAVLAAATVWALVFGTLVYLRHERHFSFDFDMGIYDQALWLLSNGGHFNTVRGLNVLGHHANFGFFLFVPFSWLGFGAHMMNLTQVVVLALGSVAVFRAARFHLSKRGDSDWWAVVPAVAFLLHFSLGWLVWELFHPDVMAITPLLFAYSYALERRWRPYALFLFLALIWKEDVGLATAALGLVLLLRREMKVGLVTIMVGAVWFLGTTQVIMPAFSPDGVFYAENFYGELGSSGTEILANSVRNPDLVLERLDQSEAPSYAFGLSAPYALVSFLSPVALLIGLGQVYANLLSTASFTWSQRYHYVAIPIVALTIAMVEGLARPKRREVRRALAAAVVVSALGTTIAWGASPISRHYDDGYWPLRESQLVNDQRAALAVVPDGAAVSATYNLVPQLTGRREIYAFPNPWQGKNWGVDDVNPRDPASIEWLVIDWTTLGPNARATEVALAESILISGAFEVVFEQGPVTVARRVSPPG
jgi:uncharacterized membrane protein